MPPTSLPRAHSVRVGLLIHCPDRVAVLTFAKRCTPNRHLRRVFVPGIRGSRNSQRLSAASSLQPAHNLTRVRLTRAQFISPKPSTLTPPETTTMEIARENLESLSYRELQALAKSRSVKANGKKEELIRRILQVRHATFLYAYCNTTHRVRPSISYRE